MQVVQSDWLGYRSLKPVVVICSGLTSSHAGGTPSYGLDMHVRAQRVSFQDILVTNRVSILPSLV